MPFPVMPSDVSTPEWERMLIGIGIAFLHLLLMAWLLRDAGHGAAGTGDRLQGFGAALSVTFVSLSPLSKPALAGPTDTPPPVEPNLENGTANQTTQAAIKVLQVLAETGEHMSPIHRSLEQVSTVSQTAEVSASPAANGDSPGNDRLAAYHSALRASIRQKWQALTDRPFPSGCGLRMMLAAGGALNATSANGCALSTEDRLQLEAAALMAQPLPYAGFESVFVPELQLDL